MSGAVWFSDFVNGNLLSNDDMTNTWDAANRLLATVNQDASIVNHYDGLGNRVGRTQDGQRVDYALDVAIGLPEVIYTSEGHKYLHLPGLIMTESDTGERRYLLGDGLGSVRHVVDEAGVVVAYREYSPYGEPVGDTETNYGFTGEWWESEVGLLHLRARWYDPGMGTFLSRDVIESEPAYQYVRGNVTNLIDPSGLCSEPSNRAKGCPDWMADWVFNGIDWLINATASPVYAPNVDGQSGDINDLIQQAQAEGTGMALPMMGMIVDFSPGYGDAKGVVEVFTGEDLATGQDLGYWRWAGIFFLSELRYIGVIDDVLEPCSNAVLLYSKKLSSQGSGGSIDPIRFKRMKDAFQRNGGFIDQSPDIELLLQMRGLEGWAVNEKMIFLPPNPTTAAVFEEFIHTAQHRTGKVTELVAKYGQDKAELLLETEAAEKLIRNAKVYGLSEKELHDTIERLKQFTEELQNLK